MNCEFADDRTIRTADMDGIVGRDWVCIVAAGRLGEAAVIAIFVAMAFVAARQRTARIGSLPTSGDLDNNFRIAVIACVD